MKKAFGIMVLVATSAGVLAIPAVASDRAGDRYTAPYAETCYGNAGYHSRDIRHRDRRDVRYRGVDRDWR